MDQATLQEYATRLDATGLHFARLDRDPDYAGVRHVWTKVPWDAVILRFAAASGGWTIIDGLAPATVTALRIEP